ncbi:hypothetical protein BM613_02390 [Sulfoacidibacillus thermotolerans]|uniref:Lipid II isoglutaminyl synthase (glutamine-hydrolyzing) subunit GatD n=1 Tax=Sulfoacidibacillus thermotolerans TaxID=1765684 RepID=A0A2U3DCL8_SULT2|nr:hypothetical protein BM613_02390 [Sulfoacidibacillus thermotolerans]
MKIRLGHLFPELLNLYADQGNIAVLKRRAALRNILLEVTPIKLGNELKVEDFDLLLLGGGSDREQAIVGKELAPYREDLQAAIEANMPILAICGGYQLLGKFYELANGERIPGLRLVDMETKPGHGRLIGNIAIEWMAQNESSKELTIVGFENHGGRTYHDYPALGKVLKGHGNNGRDHLEGLQYKSLIGTYIHGPLLPKNPHLADAILRYALNYRGHFSLLEALDDQLEWDAHHAVLQELLGNKKYARVRQRLC